ncbi:DNA-protecting protein DprA [candidate division KSB1 bacterium]|nr:DNA-protecting protein DprA [candidate division KSB1 bacterium]
MYIDLEQLINLNAVPGVGPTRLRALVAFFRSTGKIFQASIKELTSVNGVDYKTAKSIQSYSNHKFGEAQVKKAETEGIKIIHFWDEAYPENLKRIYDPPGCLYVKGDFDKQDKFAISVVGTRLPTSYGKTIVDKISKDLGKKGITIVSGLARGIDTLSHLAALRSGSRTIAVLGSGLDKIYPPENKKLADKIFNQGAVISEFPFGTKPDGPNFPRRNRIIAGLSLGTIVIEAGIKSGALLTANYALEHNREVFAVPGNINSPRSDGANQLIKDGARPISGANDVLIELAQPLKYFLKSEKEPENKIPKNLSDIEKTILEVLSGDPIHIDTLAPKIGKSTAETLSLLLPLEFKDLVKQLPGKLFVKI